MRILIILLALFTSVDAFAGGPRIFMAAAKRAASTPAPLVPSNPGFESAVATTPTAGNWYVTALAGDFGGAAASERVSNAEIAGSYALHLQTIGGWEGDEEFGTPYESGASFSYDFPVADINASSGTVTFDVRPKQYSSWGQLFMWLTSFDAGGNNISKVSGFKWFTIYGNNAGYPGAPGNDISLGESVTPNTTYTRTFDLKALATSQLAAGKTWSDVSKVQMLFYAISPDDGSPVEVLFDNFR